MSLPRIYLDVSKFVTLPLINILYQLINIKIIKLPSNRCNNTKLYETININNNNNNRICGFKTYYQINNGYY